MKRKKKWEEMDKKKREMVGNGLKWKTNGRKWMKMKNKWEEMDENKRQMVGNG